MRYQMLKVGAPLLALCVLSTVTDAQESDVDRQIDAAVSEHQHDHHDRPFAALLHGERDPLRRSDRGDAVLLGPFRFGGASDERDAPDTAAR